MKSSADTRLRRLWRCARCRRRFANRNQTHACGRYELADHFKDKPPAIRALFRAAARMLRSNGPLTILPEKTRIAFQVRMSFAQLTPRKSWIDGHFVLARRAPNPMVRRIESMSRRNHVHHFRLTGLEDLDATFAAYAAEAYRVGRQEHLQRNDRYQESP